MVTGFVLWETVDMQKIVWKDEKAFHGWGCSDCGFVLPNPRALVHVDGYITESKAAFDAHDCAKFPLKPKREDFSQAAAWIVREATEEK